jgi:hypothetical protein
MAYRPMRFERRAVARYLRGNRVRGWLNAFSGTAIAALSLHQVERGYGGSVAEIGVHHGKLFFVLYLTTAADESAIAIDVFGAQHLNLDQSGRGDKDVFLSHARRFSRSLDGLRIIEESSLNLTPDHLHAEGAPVRIFSIDGAHTAEATLSDLQLAEAAIADHGIVVLDDVFNEFWPEVSVGFARYMNDAGTLVPFAITPGKVYIAKPPFAPAYAQVLARQFPRRVDKSAHLHGHLVQILGVMPWSVSRRIARSGLGGAVRRLLGRTRQREA